MSMRKRFRQEVRPVDLDHRAHRNHPDHGGRAASPDHPEGLLGGHLQPDRLERRRR
jgi:hypothetical protein